eukprot:TRINITY_DN7727_c0_g1::TRINITY_DN7727_c0_g1_i1::g.8316::m.8316 TRINITY_DN7727_c0_g1::TRINITY_DN7727_c0_g1_i1::g.8316  ORF type:complete len:1220 (+),score=387.87,sp/Q2M389/WASC4_HUMAN/40.43/0.0,WASH-7_mid/PF14744.1/3.7e+03,WASH-7_mid/PF14744.1/2.5e-148,WASH-7_N/PF14745.1/6.7e-108,WASH-7_N/PF14745.1/1.1e-06,WASH-7_C/PF14746.1/1.1e-61 TRINITY_DN7727_c0_g1_i1:76-3660(+)
MDDSFSFRDDASMRDSMRGSMASFYSFNPSADNMHIDAFTEDSSVHVAEHLKNLKQFTLTYAEKLREIELALSPTLTESWDRISDPIHLLTEPREKTDCVDLVSTENVKLSKVMIVMSYLVWEAEELKRLAPSKFYAPLMLFGELPGNDTDNPVEGDLQISMGRMLPLMRDLSFFLKRVMSLATNTLFQICSLTDEGKAGISYNKHYFRGANLICLFRALGQLLTILITVDEIVLQNEELLDGWGNYKRMMKTVHAEPSRFGLNGESELSRLEAWLISIDRDLLGGDIFRKYMEQLVSKAMEGDCPVDLRSHTFLETFSKTLRMVFDRLYADIGTKKEIDERTEMVGFLGMLALHSRISGKPVDKKFYKNIYSSYKKLPAVILYQKVVFFPQDFLIHNIPPPTRQLSPSDMNAARKDVLKERSTGFSKEVQSYFLQVTTWTAQMESSYLADVAGGDTKSLFQASMNLICHGALLARQISRALSDFINLHMAMSVPMTTSNMRAAGQCAEILKAIEMAFHGRTGMIAERLPHVMHLMAQNLLRRLKPLQFHLFAETKRASGKARAGSIFGSMGNVEVNFNITHDMSSLVSMVIDLLAGCISRQRLTVVNVAWELFEQKARAFNVISEDTLDKISTQLWKLNVICDVGRLVEESCDASILYWTQDFTRVLLADIYSHPAQAHRVQYILASFNDGARLLRCARHVENPSVLIDGLYKDTVSMLEGTIIDPLCRDIEDDLRLHIHSAIIVQELEQRNPMKTGVRDLSPFLTIRPLRIHNSEIDLKQRVAHYLNANFYNLTTVALHNWMTYSEMRNLAKEKYGLELTDGHLPSQTLGQGLDVLEVMRNIHIFVKRFSYNMDTEMFLETRSDGRHLNTISIRHIANSLRTHGTGMMNTTVNFTYQFLVQKMMVLSQFLFDDHIKSRLIKDVRFFKNEKQAINNRYPYDRSLKFLKSIRKLGLTQDGLTYIDKFRQLITEIGNALGYVRMVRSGGLNYCSNAIKFVPDLTAIPQFEPMAQEETLCPDTVKAAKNLDAVLNNLYKSFSEGSDYNNILVQVFAQELRGKQNRHLKNFYAILPPLSINYVQYMLVSKDKLTKKTNKDTTFTDDGFPLGVAYLLKVLDLNEEFDTFHWFESVNEYFEEERKKVVQTMESTKRGNEEEIQTLNLTLKKLEATKAEFELFYFTFSSARIFFRGADDV